jgi:hypothetical protein
VGRRGSDTNNLQRKRVIAQLRKFKGQEDAQEWVGFKRDEARKAEEEKAAAQAEAGQRGRRRADSEDIRRG